MIVSTLLATALLSAAAPLQSESNPPASPSAVAPPPQRTRVAAVVVRTRPQGNQNSRVICKNTTETGTRMVGHRICLPESVWTDQEQQTREMMDKMGTFMPR